MRARPATVALVALALLATAAWWWLDSGARRHPAQSIARDARPAVGAIEQPAGEGLSAGQVTGEVRRLEALVRIRKDGEGRWIIVA